jgi:hypothetical protein
MDHQRSWLEMIGDALRELSVLSLLFVPLDSLVAERPFGWIDFGYTAAGCIALFAFGGILEKIRKW